MSVYKVLRVLHLMLTHHYSYYIWSIHLRWYPSWVSLRAWWRSKLLSRTTNAILVPQERTESAWTDTYSKSGRKIWVRSSSHGRLFNYNFIQSLKRDLFKKASWQINWLVFELILKRRKHPQHAYNHLHLPNRPLPSHPREYTESNDALDLRT